MNVQILRLSDKTLIPGEIEEKGKYKLPSIKDGWNFDFNKQSKQLSNDQTYVLVTELEPEIIQGCLILRLYEDSEPHMAFIEVAPHNRGDAKKYDYVAGCLIAYASRLSHIHAEGSFKGYLSFLVAEESKEDTNKLIEHYKEKYHAAQIHGLNYMVIDPKNGRKLIEKYLHRK